MDINNLTTLFYSCINNDIFQCSSAVERLTVNQDVAGSIPAAGAKRRIGND